MRAIDSRAAIDGRPQPTIYRAPRRLILRTRRELAKARASMIGIIAMRQILISRLSPLRERAALLFLYINDSAPSGRA